MRTLRTLNKLLFGETWLVPLGRGGPASARLGGFVLLAGVLAVLLLSVARSARPRAGGRASARSDAGAAAPRAPSSVDTLPGGLPDA